MELDLQKEIAAALKKIKDVPVYRETVPQDFVTPSFIVLFDEINPISGINGRLNNSIRVDVSYFPLDASRNKNTDCWTVGQQLRRQFKLQHFKVKNRTMRITDDILHFMFVTEAREFLDMHSPKMLTILQTYKSKEE